MPDVDGKITYRLYALPLTWESIYIAERERFSRATPTPEPGYVLIYTADKQPERSKAITEQQRELLTKADMTWLAECGATILAEEAARNQSKLMESLSERVTALEEELRRRKQEIKTKGKE